MIRLCVSDLSPFLHKAYYAGVRKIRIYKNFLFINQCTHILGNVISFIIEMGESVEKSIPRDHRLSSLGKPCDANQ